MSWSQLSKLLLSTLGSRVLGLVRDVLFGAVLGGGYLQDAFVTAFTLPNLLRRLLGEGALTSALIPMLAQEQADGGDAAAKKLLNQVITRLTLILSAICLVLTSACLCVGWDPSPSWGSNSQEMSSLAHLPKVQFVKERPDGGPPPVESPAEAKARVVWEKAVKIETIKFTGRFGAVMMPYLILVCLAAAVAAALNHLRVFDVPARSQVWFNVIQIGAVGLMYFFCRNDNESGVYVACFGVLIGGLIQLATPFFCLLRNGWRLAWDLSHTPALGRLMRLLGPGLLGAGVFQINTAFSRFFCAGLEEGAPTVLYNVNRFTELPLGLFAFSIITLVFPALAAAASKNDLPDFAAQFHRGLRLILAVTVPAAAGLWALREPIVRFVYQHGKFGENSVANTLPIMGLFAFGIPLFALGSFVGRAFHARQDMATPLKAAILNLILNAVLCVTLGKLYGLPGLACGILTAYGVHALGLSFVLWRKLPEMRRHAVLVPLLQIILPAVAMGAVCFLSWRFLDSHWGHGKMLCLAALLVFIPLGGVFYFSLLHLLRFAELRELTGALLRRFRR